MLLMSKYEYWLNERKVDFLNKINYKTFVIKVVNIVLLKSNQTKCRFNLPHFSKHS